MTEEVPASPAKEEADAIARIALTNDGLLLHRFLRRVLEGVLLTEHSGALRDHNGRRTLARDLMCLMAPGVESNRDRTSSADTSILASGSRAIAVTGAGSARRRVALEPGDGWSAELEPGTGSPGPGSRRRAT